MPQLATTKFGPFRGYQSSVEAVMAPPDFIVGKTSGLSGAGSSRDVQLDPASGQWFRRKGCAIIGDTLTGSGNTEAAVGLLESGMKFAARPRKGFALKSPSLTNGRSTPAVLYGYDNQSASFPTVDNGGWCGTIYARNSNGSGENYNLLREFGSSHYPTNTGTFVPASSGLVVCPPLWYESADGGYHRGANQFTRRFMAAGSRSTMVAGKYVVLPNLRGTPIRWDGTLNNITGSSTANTVRYFPLGPFAPIHPGNINNQTASTANDSSWVDGDTFYYSVIFKFEDGSYSQPFLPRPANSILASRTGILDGGIGLRVVGTIGGTAKYASLTWNNVPIGPAGTVARLMCRTPKQNRTATTDAITVSPFDLRVTGIITNNTQTSYTDSNGNDTGLIENDNIVRLDTVCPRRARYVWSGDQRVQVGYTLPNPCAIMLAPIGASDTSYGHNLPDDDGTTVQGTSGYVYRITSTGLDLQFYDTTNQFTAAPFSIDFATYDTLQKVVDRINSTTAASSCKLWRAQICPGADSAAAATSLCLSTHQVANCTTGGGSSTTLTTSGSFANVPVGYYITGTGVTTGTYVVSKQSNTSLTMSAAMTVAAATTLDFSAYTGDGTGAANYWGGAFGGKVGYMRAFCGAYPGFIYFKRSALPGYDVPDKQRVFFTVGSPGAASAGSSVAINTWGADNFRLPTISNPGILLGGVDIEGASVVGYSGGVALFKNVKGVNSGEDFDYKLFTINGSRGPCSWSALVGGNGWAAYTTREGVFATDKNLREYSLSGAVFNPTRGLGDLAYEIDFSVASTDADDDSSTLQMSVLRSRLVIAYSQSDSVLSSLWYDFSPGLEASGVEELANPDSKQPYGWSAPCTYNATLGGGLTAFFAVPASTGMTYYGCCAVNSTSAVGDGRIDQIETGNKDNAESQFTGYAYMPVLTADDFSRLSPQRIQVLHRKPNGTSLTLIKTSRDQLFASSTSYTLTATGSNQYTYEIVQLQSAVDRGPTDLFWMMWQDTEATQGNGLWSVALQYQNLPT